MRRAWLALAIALTLAACDRDGRDRTSAEDTEASASASGAGTSDAPLPAPLGAPGQGVTGMPDAADLPPARADQALPDPENPVSQTIDPALIDPNLAPPPSGSAAGTPATDAAAAAAIAGITAAPGAPATEPPPEAEPQATDPEATPEHAAEVVRQYHAEIDRGAFDRAYALCADGGRASGQSLEGFAASLRETVNIMADVRAPTRLRSGVGTQYIEVPVAVTVDYRDGRRRRLTGAYLLRRSTNPEAGESQRRWRISSVLLKEAPQ